MKSIITKEFLDKHCPVPAPDPTDDEWNSTIRRLLTAAVRVAEFEAEQRAVAAAAAMFCPYRSGKRCDHTEKPCDHECELMDKFRADMRNFRNADYWVEDDELAQKVKKANARIEVLLKNGKNKQGRVITGKNPAPTPGSWSERETTLKTAQNEKTE